MEVETADPTADEWWNTAVAEIYESAVKYGLLKPHQSLAEVGKEPVELKTQVLVDKLKTLQNEEPEKVRALIQVQAKGSAYSRVEKLLLLELVGKEEDENRFAEFVEKHIGPALTFVSGRVKRLRDVGLIKESDSFWNIALVTAEILPLFEVPKKLCQKALEHARKENSEIAWSHFEKISERTTRIMELRHKALEPLTFITGSTRNAKRIPVGSMVRLRNEVVAPREMTRTVYYRVRACDGAFGLRDEKAGAERNRLCDSCPKHLVFPNLSTPSSPGIG